MKQLPVQGARYGMGLATVPGFGNVDHPSPYTLTYQKLRAQVPGQSYLETAEPPKERTVGSASRCGPCKHPSNRAKVPVPPHLRSTLPADTHRHLPKVPARSHLKGLACLNPLTFTPCMTSPNNGHIPAWAHRYPRSISPVSPYVLTSIGWKPHACWLSAGVNR